MELSFAASAAKAIKALPKHDAQALIAKLETFAAEPFTSHAFAKSFGDGVVRIRHGDWRAVCEIFQDRLVVLVVKVGHRREVYR